MRAIYPTDLSDAEWKCLTRHLPAKRPRGRPSGHPLRAILMDTRGLPISISVTSADTHDKVGARRRLQPLTSAA